METFAHAYYHRMAWNTLCDHRPPLLKFVQGTASKLNEDKDTRTKGKSSRNLGADNDKKRWRIKEE